MDPRSRPHNGKQTGRRESRHTSARQRQASPNDGRRQPSTEGGRRLLSFDVVRYWQAGLPSFVAGVTGVIVP
jgi:hypothetical protein